jgi:transcription elongation factor GreA
MEDTNKLTKEGLRQYEDELHNLKVNRRQEIAQKIKEAREQGDLSENAEYDAARDEQRDVEARIEELENILKNVVIMDVDHHEGEIEAVVFGCTVRIKDLKKKKEVQYTIKGGTEANVLNHIISNESPLGMALIGAKKGDVVKVEAPAGLLEYEVLDIWFGEK